MELSTTKSTNQIVKAAFGVIKEAHYYYAEYRVKQFLKTIDSEVESLTSERQAEINEFLSQERTKKVLADYAAAITNTSSEIVLRALALLLIDDRQFDFSTTEKARFIACISGMDDLKVSFFIQLSTLRKLEFNTVYPIYSIDNRNFDELNLGVGIDELFAYTADFISRGLLLRDPRGDLGSNFCDSKDDDWSICFGISTTLRRYAALLDKAKYLAQE